MITTSSLEESSSDGHESPNKLLALARDAVSLFDKMNWVELGDLTKCGDLVEGHKRLLRSLRFGDEDYLDNAYSVLGLVAARDVDNLRKIQRYVELVRSGGAVVDSLGKEGKVVGVECKPRIFRMPDDPVSPSLVAVMMPFSQDFDEVYASIKSASNETGFDCKRVDDFWKHSEIIHDIFHLIYTARVVVCDFTGKNPNVFYETGIAHTLGKQVLPISQNKADIPFDLQHHRYVPYLNNSQGRGELKKLLKKRLETLRGTQA